MASQSPIIKLTKYFPIIEVISLIVFVVGFLMKSLHYPGGNEIILISLSILSIIYFLTGYMPREAPKETDTAGQPMGFAALLGRTIVPKILSIGSSVAVIGILFTILHFNGFREMLLIGSTTMAGASVVGLLNTQNDEEGRRALGPLMVRAIPLMLIGIYLLWVHGISPPAV